MNVNNPKWSLVRNEVDVNQHKYHIDGMRIRLEDFDRDSDKKARLEAQECKYCWYINTQRLGGAAITNTNCSVCGKEMVFGSTNVDKVCKECAKEHELCKHCGTDLNMRVRRKKEFPK